MEFRLLGPLEVEGGDGAVALGGAKQRASSLTSCCKQAGWSARTA